MRRNPRREVRGPTQPAPLPTIQTAPNVDNLFDDESLSPPQSTSSSIDNVDRLLNDMNHDEPPHFGNGGPPPPPPPAPAPPAGLAALGLTPEVIAQLAALIQVLQPAAPAPVPAAPHQPVSRTKVREPDAFDGSDPSKLRNFLIQNELVFRNRPAEFTDEEKRINHALSYLTGTAQQWFQPYIEMAFADQPQFLHDWSESTLR